MDILIEGSRSTNESWVRAFCTPEDGLPELSSEEKATAVQMRIPMDQYRRTRLAVALAEPEWAEKAGKVAQLVKGWMEQHEEPGSI